MRTAFPPGRLCCFCFNRQSASQIPLASRFRPRSLPPSREFSFSSSASSSSSSPTFASSSPLRRPISQHNWQQQRTWKWGKSQYNYNYQNGSYRFYSWRRAPSAAGRTTAVLIAGAAALSPAAFLQLAAENGNNDDTTRELEMLEASRNELRDKRQSNDGAFDDDVRGVRRAIWRIYMMVDEYVLEIMATGFRFLHLVVIFAPVIATVPVIWFGRRVRDRDNERRGVLWWYRFLVSAMERAGPAFIKLGQWAASRTDIFPPELCTLMSSLHSHAPAHSLRVTKETISRAFNGLPFEDIFEEFDEQPLGVGAIAQVYKAKLSSDLAVPSEAKLGGQPANLRQKVRKNVDVLVKSTPQRVPSSYVAIKVLHPKVDRIVRRDLRIMGFFAGFINFIPTMEWLSLPDEVTQFGNMMRLQLDLRIEATNLTLFRENFKSRTTAWFPYPYSEYTTREVLVEEFAQGIPLSAFMENGGGVFQREIAQEGLDAFLHMLLIDNFVHADLHPGNIMVRFYKPGQLDLSLKSGHQHHGSIAGSESNDITESVLSRLREHRKDTTAWNKTLDEIDAEGYRPQLIFIDTGLVTELNSINRRNFLDLFRAIAEFDGYKAGCLMVERSRQPDAVLDPEIFALKVQRLVLSVKGRTFALGNVKVGDVLSHVLSLVRNYHVRLEGDFVNVVISILLLEGIGRSLDPDLDLFKSALPILRQLGSGTTLLKSVREGDTSMLRVWVGLEARNFLQTSIGSVEWCVKYDQLSPNI